MSTFIDLGKAVARAFKGVPMTQINDAPEQHRALREADRNIASNRRVRVAAQGVLDRLNAREAHR
jgi:hypothetical protein